MQEHVGGTFVHEFESGGSGHTNLFVGFVGHCITQYV